MFGKITMPRWKVGLATIALAAVVAIPVAADSHTENMAFEVEGGDLSAVLSTAPDGALSSSDFDAGKLQWTWEPDDLDGALELVATDETGTGAGWNVALAATNFNYEEPDGVDTQGVDLTIGEAGNAAFLIESAGGPVLDGSGQPVGTEVTAGSDPTGSLADGGQVVMSATEGNGMGSYSQEIDVKVELPEQIFAGTYTSTLTATITAGPEVN